MYYTVLIRKKVLIKQPTPFESKGISFLIISEKKKEKKKKSVFTFWGADEVLYLNKWRFLGIMVFLKILLLFKWLEEAPKLRNIYSIHIGGLRGGEESDFFLSLALYQLIWQTVRALPLSFFSGREKSFLSTRTTVVRHLYWHVLAFSEIYFPPSFAKCDQ